MWRIRFLVALGVLAAVGLAALHLTLRREAELIESLAVLAALFSAVALLSVGLVKRRERQVIGQLAERLSEFRATACPSPLAEQFETPPAVADEWEPLLAEVEELSAAYRKASTEVMRAQEALENLPSVVARARSENGHSHSSIHSGQRSRRSDQMIARIASSLHWMSATPALQRLLGQPLPELSRRSFLEWVHPDDAPLLVDRLQDAVREGEAHNVVVRLRSRVGPDRFLHLDVVTRYNADGSPLHLRCHFLDVTERMRAEQELRLQSLRLEQANQKLRDTNAGLERLKESYRDLYHKAPVLYFSLDPRACFAACNDTMLTTLGYVREDLLGKPYTRLLTVEEARRFLGEPAVYARTGEIETRWVKKDGTVIDVWIRTAPTVDEHGRFVRSRSAAQDVTERNRLADELRVQAGELQEANECLQRINHELDEFTYVVSHDLKEPLRTLEAFSTILKQDYGERLGSDGADHINHLVEASRRLGRLIDDLLSLGHAGRVINTPRAFDLGEVVSTVVADLSDLIQRRHAELRVEGPLPVVVGDRERIAQLLANLVGNGLKYNRSDRPNVVLGLLPPTSANGHGNGTEGQVTLFVRDNGIGIAPEYHEQIFRVFRRLHRREEYEGTGAGLAICKKIVEAHGGRIWVDSNLGAGSTFYVTLRTPGY
jgi:PAS domain S-box-containing protein